MLIALMTILFLGGGGSSAVLGYIADSTDAVKEVLQDDDRREEALETMDSLKDLGKQENKARQEVLKQMEDVLGEHDTSSDVVDDLWSGYYQQVREINDAALDHRFALRDQLSREEWEEVFALTATDENSD